MEAKPDGGDQFGEDGVREVIAGTASLAPTEVVRLVIEAVVGHRGAALRDDATVVCLDWQA
jgi:serine phosphatase RsbU (regulator of sigma subunit)